MRSVSMGEKMYIQTCFTYKTDMLKNKKDRNIFLHLHPLQRISISMIVTVLVFLLTRSYSFTWQSSAILMWDVFAVTLLITDWIVIFKMPIDQIISRSNKEDGSRVFVLISVLFTCFSSLLTVLLMIISKDAKSGHEALTLVLAITGMIASWLLTHTILTFHYAHLYYSSDKKDTADNKNGLEFPEEEKPDYRDFAYFSFVIGMTFQVSDVEINSRIIRRLVLAHGLISFALNTFVVALTINLIAGLMK